MKTTRAITVAVAVLIAAVPLAAQDAHEHAQQRTDMQGMMAQDMGMMQMMRTAPHMLLRAAEELGLNDRQLQTLRYFQERFDESHGSHTAAALTSCEAAKETLSEERPDWARYEASMTHAASEMGAAHVAMVRASFDAKAVLDADQLEMIEGGLMDPTMSGMGDMGQMGMMGDGRMCTGMGMMGGHGMNGADMKHPG